MEEKTGVLDKFEVIAKVATNPMWDDIAEKIYDGDDSMLGTHHWEGCPLPMIPTVEFMDDGTNLLIVTKEGYEAFKSADSDEVIFAGCNGIKGTYDMKKNAIDEVYVVPEEFILEYGASKEVREEFVRTQREKRWKIEDEEEVEIDDETKKKFLRTLPDEIVPDKSEEALNKIIENEKLNPLDEEDKTIHIRFGKNISIIKTIDEFGFEEDYEMIQYSYNGKIIEERAYQCNEYVHESRVSKCDENEECIYSKSRYENNGDDTYYDTLKNNDANYKELFNSYKESLEVIDKDYSKVESSCVNVLHPDSKVNNKCEAIIVGYEEVINTYISDVNSYNELIDSYNKWLDDNSSTDPKLEKIKLDRDYLDINGDREYAGRSEAETKIAEEELTNGAMPDE